MALRTAVGRRQGRKTTPLFPLGWLVRKPRVLSALSRVFALAGKGLLAAAGSPERAMPFSMFVALSHLIFLSTAVPYRMSTCSETAGPCAKPKLPNNYERTVVCCCCVVVVVFVVVDVSIRSHSRKRSESGTSPPLLISEMRLETFFREIDNQIPVFPA